MKEYTINNYTLSIEQLFSYKFVIFMIYRKESICETGTHIHTYTHIHTPHFRSLWETPSALMKAYEGVN